MPQVRPGADKEINECVCAHTGVHTQSLSHVRLCVTPWTGAHQAPRPWDCPGKNTGVGCHFFLKGIFLTQGLKLQPWHLLHWQVDSLLLGHLGSHQGSPYLYSVLLY